MPRALTFLCLSLALGFSAATAPTGQGAVPLPASVIGFEPCSDYKLATYEQIAAYFQALDGASPRLRLVDIGRTAEGRTQMMAVISSEENLRHLDRYQAIARRLALARGLSDEEAGRLAAEGRAVVWIDFGLHSTEVAHAQTAPLLAHRLVTDESDEIRRIRDRVVFLLVPNMNPDGTTLVANWYMNHVGTPYEKSPPPELYHKYVGHDNNRDWFMFNMPESRNVARQLYAEWFPQIVYNQHQTAPFPARIFVPPFDDPMNPEIPPLVMRGVNAVGHAMARRLEQEGRSGVISRIQFDMWWNGGMRTAPYFHNMIGILTETAHASASPATYDSAAFPGRFANGLPTLEPTVYYPNPYRGGHWRIRDSCDYMISASLATLDIGASRHREWLYDIYRMGRDAIERGAGEWYVVPADQWDVPTALKMVNVLRLGGVEVHRATAAFTLGGEAFAAGSFVIAGAQPFRPYVRDLLNPQVYPDLRPHPGGPPRQPYDITGWTLPFQMGVRVVRHTGPLDADLEVVTREVSPSGRFPASAPRYAYALDPRINDSFTAVNRLLRAGAEIHRSTEPVEVSTGEWPAGTFLIPSAPRAASALRQAAEELGLTVAAVDEAPRESWRLRLPRVGLYRAWGGNMDEGWTRWLLEQFAFPFTTVRDDEIRGGTLGKRYDVLLLPHATYESMLSGLSPDRMPPEYAGGMTPRGVAGLYEFVSRGGTLVTLGGAAELPLATFGLPVRDVTAQQPATDFFIPGALLRVRLDPRHPLAFGMPPEAAAFFARSPAFRVGRGTRTPAARAAGEPEPAVPDIHPVAEYPDRDLLMSGWLLGESVIGGRAAALEARVDQGRVILLGFRVQHRAQPHGTFKLLFNAIYLAGSERVAAPAGTAHIPARGR
jgi:hypothetical protein